MQHITQKIQQKFVDLIELDSEEELVCMIKRHPIGLVGVTFTGLLIALAVVAGSSVLGSWIDTQPDINGGFNIGVYITLFGILMGIIVGFFTFVAAYVYNNSVILVTSDKVAQVLYTSLVNRKISQLSLGDLQDVTVEQKGIMSRVFNYGTIVIETAGEQNNFIFNYTPYPYGCAKDIVSAREMSIKKYGN